MLNATLRVVVVLGLLVLLVSVVIAYCTEPPSSSEKIVRTALRSSGSCDPTVAAGRWINLSPCTGVCTGAQIVQQFLPADGTVCDPPVIQTVSCASQAPCVCAAADWQASFPLAQACGGVCDNATPGQQCLIGCSTGLTSGNNSLVCLANGTWGLPTDFSCSPSEVSCPPIPQATAAYFAVQGTCVGAQAGQTCTLACRTGYQPGPAGSELSCTYQGSWSIDPQQACIPQTCGDDFALCSFVSS